VLSSHFCPTQFCGIGLLLSSIERYDNPKAVYAEVTTARLQTLIALFDAGKITTRVGSILPLSEVRQAQAMLAGAPHKPGKIVLRIGRPE
jgi:NADPH:quinone reductase-like Zn-dependent oxidoreductase